MEALSAASAPSELAEDGLGFFRWGRIGGQVLITTDAGDWTFLSDAQFDELLAGRIAAGHDRFEELQRKGFLREGLDLDALADRLAQRSRHMRHGPRVHVVTLTRRRGPAGNGVDESAADLTAATAEHIVEFALQSSAPAIAFELQGDGGEPLLNFDVLRHLVEFARARNERSLGKALTFRVFTNLTGMNEAAAEWLVANDVSISTSLDGPAPLHDANRQWRGGSAHADVVRWLDDLRRRYAELKRTPAEGGLEALMTVTRRTLGSAREVVDEYVARGLDAIYLRPLEARRVDADTWGAIGYTAAEYLDFYRKALDYILELNRGGVSIAEGRASIFLRKILGSEDAGVVDIQSPNGAGSGELAYDIDGRVFPSDEARLVDAMGEPMFLLGQVRELTVSAIVRHPTVRAIATASLLDAQPMCAECWNKPFCGFSPVRNFLTQGDLFGQRPRALECKEHMAVSARMFELLGDESDAETVATLKRWSAAGPSPAASSRAERAAP